MKLSRVQGVAGLFLAALLSVPAWATNNASSNSAVPGTVNYVEGQALVADQPLDKDSVGKTTVAVGQSLDTDTGKAELLLTPGVFLREGDRSSVKMVAAGLTDTELQNRSGPRHGGSGSDLSAEQYPRAGRQCDCADFEARPVRL